MRKAKKTPKYLWAIAYIDSSLVGQLEKDLKKSNQYQGMVAVVPTIKVLKKHFKGKETFQDVPLLFHYGFIKIPYLYAINPDMLEKLRNDISCISHWVQDRALGNPHAKVALVKPSEVKRMIKFAQENNTHSEQDINNLKVGQIITLMGYPFEGLDARIISINLKKKQVEVEVKLSSEVLGDEGEWATLRTISISFDNVFYTAYNGSYHDDYNKEKTLTDYQHKKLNNGDENK